MELESGIIGEILVTSSADPMMKIKLRKWHSDIIFVIFNEIRRCVVYVLIQLLYTARVWRAVFYCRNRQTLGRHDGINCHFRKPCCSCQNKLYFYINLHKYHAKHALSHQNEYITDNY